MIAPIKNSAAFFPVAALKCKMADLFCVSSKETPESIRKVAVIIRFNDQMKVVRLNRIVNESETFSFRFVSADFELFKKACMSEVRKTFF